MINGNTMTLVMEHTRLSDFHQKMAHSQKLTLQRDSSLNVHVIIHQWLNGFPLGLLHPYKWSYITLLIAGGTLTFQVSREQTPQNETAQKSSKTDLSQSIQYRDLGSSPTETPWKHPLKNPINPQEINKTLRRKKTFCTYAIHHPFPI